MGFGQPAEAGPSVPKKLSASILKSHISISKKSRSLQPTGTSFKVDRRHLDSGPENRSDSPIFRLVALSRAI